MTDDATLLCELCETPMTAQRPEGSPMAYFHCAGCGRWVASPYGDELMRAGTARLDARAANGQDGTRTDGFDAVRERLARWMARLDESDPYHVLGLPASSAPETVHARFKELALEHHPDRGGDPAKMRRIIEAYDRIRRGKRAVLVDCPATPAPVRVAPRGVRARRA